MERDGILWFSDSSQIHHLVLLDNKMKVMNEQRCLARTTADTIGRELREQLHLKSLRDVGIHGAFLTKVRVSKEIVTERGRMLNTSSLKEYAYAARLDGGHHDMAIRLLALGMSDNPIVLTQGKMNQATLVCVHRGKGYLAVTTLGALGG